MSLLSLFLSAYIWCNILHNVIICFATLEKEKCIQVPFLKKTFKKALARAYMHSVEVFAIYFFVIYNEMEQLLCNQYLRTCCNKPCNDVSYFIWKKAGETTIGSIQRKCEGYFPGNLSVCIVYYHLRYVKTRRYCGLI